MKRLTALAAIALALAACVSVEEAPLTKGAIQPGQRTVIVIYPPPGPVMSESDSKAETAAKLIPGISFAVQDAQNERDLASSKDLQQYLPAWKPADEFYPMLRSELQKSGSPGRFLPASEADIDPALLAEFNKSDNVVDWRTRYYDEIPGRPAPRDYSRILPLDDALIFEVNFAYGLADDGDGNCQPAVSATTRLYRANSMKLLWRQEERVEDPANKKTMYDFKVAPKDLMEDWRKLMPQLAAKISDDLRSNLIKAGVSAIAFNLQPSTTTAQVQISSGPVATPSR